MSSAPYDTKNAPLEAKQERHSERKVITTGLNIEDIKRYFKLLSPQYTEKKIFCGYWWDESAGKAPLNGYGTCYRTVSDIIGEYGRFALNPKPTFHVTLNENNHRGRRTENFELARVLCVDLDIEISLDEIKSIRDTYYPHMIVESSPGKYHIYWRILPTITLDQWSLYQAGLAALFGGDINLKTISHTLRVPGFPRITKKGEEWNPRIVYYLEDAKPLNDTDIENYFPDILEKGALLGKKEKKERGVLKKEIGALEPETTDLDAIAAIVQKTYHGSNGNGPKQRTGHGTGHGRNSFLYTFIFNYVFEHGEEVEEKLMDIGKVVNGGFPEGPLPEVEMKHTIESAFKGAIEARMKQQEAKEKRSDEIKKNFAASEHPDFSYDFDAPLLKHDPWCKLSIVGRVLQKYSNHIVRASKVVYAFDTVEKVWRPQKTSKEILSGYTVDCIGDLVSNPKFISDECTNEKTGEISASKLKAFRKTYLSPACVRDVVGQVVDWDDLPRKEITDFDNDDHLLYCGNGVLNMLSGDLRPARAEDYLLQRTSVAWNENAECPEWKQYISEVYAHNEQPEQVQEFLRRVFGYSLSGGIQAQKIFVHYGESCNGKSKILAALKLIGGSYTVKLDGSNLANKGNALQKEFERIGAKVEGKRIVIIDDLDSKTEWNEGHVKSLTDYTIIARRLYEEERDIPNHATFHIACNEAPKPSSDNTAVMRRMCIIPYPRRFAQDNVKERWIMEMLQREASGILKWAVEGMIAYQKTGDLLYPTEVEESLESYKDAHLTGEEVIKNAILKVGIPHSHQSEDTTDWHGVSEITRKVNTVLKESGHQTTELVIARLLPLVGAAKARKMINGKQIRCYHIQLLNDTALKMG